MKATRDAFGEQLVISAKTNKNIIGLSADLGKATKINKFGEAYPDRLFETFCKPRSKKERSEIRS